MITTKLLLNGEDLTKFENEYNAYQHSIYEPEYYPCILIIINWDTSYGTGYNQHYLYIEDAQELIYKYWENKEKENYPDSKGFEL